jgi:hypothetical protein
MFENSLVYGDRSDLVEDPEILNQESRSQAKNFAFFKQQYTRTPMYL